MLVEIFFVSSLAHIHAYLDTHPEQGARSLRAGSVGVGESGVKV